MSDTERFIFSPELGLRLRALRRRAGLSQEKLAQAMGIKCRGNQHVISSLERGKVAHPTIGMVADYLRACRASFRDLEDLLDNYTSRPTQEELAGRQEVATVLLPGVVPETERYDRALSAFETIRYGRPVDPLERARRAAKYARSAFWRRKLHELVLLTIKRQKLHSGGIVKEKRLQDYSLRLWKKLTQVRAQRSRYQEVLEMVMAELLADGSVPEATARAVLAEVVDLFQQARDSGQFDAYPEKQ